MQFLHDIVKEFKLLLGVQDTTTLYFVVRAIRTMDIGLGSSVVELGLQGS